MDFRVSEPTVASYEFSFDIGNEDKDWDTQVGLEIIYQGRNIAERFNFNANKGDHWAPNDKKGTFYMPPSEATSLAMIDQSVVRVSAKANGNDHWKFDFHLAAVFSDGKRRTWTWNGMDLWSQNSSREHQDFFLKQP